MKYKESFLAYLQFEKHYSLHTVRSYKNDLEQYYSFIFIQRGDNNPLEVTSTDIRSWLISLMDSGYSTSSVHRKREIYDR